VPFSGHVRVVARALKQGWKRHYPICQLALIAENPGAQILAAHAGNVIVIARKEHGSCNSAKRSRLKPAELDPVLCQSIQVRRFNISAITTEVRVSQIVGYQQQDIGFPGRIFVPRSLRAGRGYE
jgi:hypothetical protein